MKSSLIDSMLHSQDRVTTRVKGRCMEPVIMDGELARVRQKAVYIPGDIITFRKASGLLVSHRFLGYVRHESEWKLVAQADSSDVHDGLIPQNMVLGGIEAIGREKLMIPVSARIAALSNLFKAVFSVIRRKLYVPEAG